MRKRTVFAEIQGAGLLLISQALHLAKCGPYNEKRLGKKHRNLLIPSGILSVLRHELNAVLRIACSIRTPRRDYGQNGDFWDFPVNGSPWLRSKHTFNVAYTNKFPDDLQLIANHPGILFETYFSRPLQIIVLASGSTPCLNQVPARIHPIATKVSLDETSSPSVAQCLRTGS